jgi:hypothetical protein
MLLNKWILTFIILKIFSDLDINKDNLIDFNEFWTWWSSGRPNKLEKMVYYKLKSMKLLKKAHADFVRYWYTYNIYVFNYLISFIY